MCGLFGFSLRTAIDKKQRQQLELAVLSLSIDNIERGNHAAGYASRHGNQWRVKRAVGPWRFDSAPISRASALIGHTRYATSGLRDSIRGAHPFALGRREARDFGMHNGQIWDAPELHRYAIDSECLLNALYHANERDLEQMDGYGTAVWTHGDALRIVRFNAGELSLVALPWAYVWTSAEKHMRAALKLARIRGAQYIRTQERITYEIRDGQFSAQGYCPIGDGYSFAPAARKRWSDMLDDELDDELDVSALAADDWFKLGHFNE